MLPVSPPLPTVLILQGLGGARGEANDKLSAHWREAEEGSEVESCDKDEDEDSC